MPTDEENWFEQLSRDLKIGSDELIKDLIDFREHCSNNLLRSSYTTPEGIKKFRTTKDFQKGTVDLILSYLDSKNFNDEISFTNQAVEKIENKVGSHKYYTTRIIDVENYRRGKYWENNQRLFVKIFMDGITYIESAPQETLRMKLFSCLKTKKKA